MPTHKRIPLFLSYSFDKKPPSWSTLSDLQVAQWFEKLLRSHGFHVLSGRKAESRPVLDKIFDAVDQSRAVVAVFTGKHKVSSTPPRLLPSQWVLCECAYAQGRFRDTEYMIAGFREKGVLSSDLASITSKNMEIPEFERDRLDRDRERFAGYLRDLEQRLLYGPTGQKEFIMSRLPFVQTRLHKIVLIYRNGYCTTQNINEFSIRDPEVFSSEYRGQISHHMWNSRQEFPPLETMLQNAIHRRKAEPFFYAKADYLGNKRLGTPLRVEVDRQDRKDIYFQAGFLSDTGEPLKFKFHDTLRYQYAWGLPSVYPVHEEDLANVEGEEINSETYCLAEAEASRGPIDDFILELRFERQCRGTERGELFSKNPIYQAGHGPATRVVWSTPRHCPKPTGIPPELDMWYEIYKLHIDKFEGRVRVAWRPSSRKYSL
jgi:hypothetical protein